MTAENLAEDIESKDWHDASPEERFEAIQQQLSGAYNVTFHRTSREVFPPTRGISSPYEFRQHYSVTVTNIGTGKSESFEYFQPEKHHGRGHDFTRSRLISFFYCISCDYGCIEDCQDALDLMDNFGYTDTKEARKTWISLQRNRNKIESLFSGNEAFANIRQIVEGY